MSETGGAPPSSISWLSSPNVNECSGARLSFELLDQAEGRLPGLSKRGSGNLTTDPTSGKTPDQVRGRPYAYSSENLLTSGSGGVTLAYDPLLRLSQVSGAATTKFAYDGGNAIAEYDGSGNVLKRYVYDPTTGQPVMEYAGNGAGASFHRFYSTDERGSVIAVTDINGNLIGINSYDEYGKPGSSNQGRFQYTGQNWVAEIGAYDYKARVYLPHLGVFGQTDPIGYADSPNPYAYVLGDPVNNTDPLGLGGAPLPVIDTNPLVITGIRRQNPPGGVSPYGPGIIDPNLRNETERAGRDIVITGIRRRHPGVWFASNCIIRGKCIAAPTPNLKPQPRRAPHYNPRVNYCGAEGGQQFPSGSWDQACYNHDICYGTVGAVRSQCDAALRDEIAIDCSNAPQACGLVSLSYWLAVRLAARTQFNPTLWLPGR